jgi:predicted ArsR family transcriptional regulator
MILVPTTMRHANQRELVRVLLQLGTASRPELARAAGVSQVTAGKIVEDLLRRGILEETDASGDDRARPGRSSSRGGRGRLPPRRPTTGGSSRFARRPARQSSKRRCGRRPANCRRRSCWQR